MKNNNRKQKDTNVNRLRRKFKGMIVLSTGALVALVSAVVELCSNPSSDDRWYLIFMIVSLSVVLICSIIIFYYWTHYRGYYRCKACGHVYEPDEEELAATLLDTRTPLVCPNCAAHNRQRKLSRKALSKLSVM